MHKHVLCFVRHGRSYLAWCADAQCAGSGINLNNACSSFTSAVKSNADRIMSADCSTLQTELVKPEYGTPSDG